MRLGNEALLTSTRMLIRQVDHVLYANVRKNKIRQLNKMMFRYFNQPIRRELYDAPHWHRALAKQLVDDTNIDIRPGMVDSKGWLSAIVEYSSCSLTFLLFEEYSEAGICSEPVETPTAMGRPISYGS